MCSNWYIQSGNYKGGYGLRYGFLKQFSSNISKKSKKEQKLKSFFFKKNIQIDISNLGVWFEIWVLKTILTFEKKSKEKQKHQNQYFQKNQYFYHFWYFYVVGGVVWQIGKILRQVFAKTVLIRLSRAQAPGFAGII